MKPAEPTKPAAEPTKPAAQASPTPAAAAAKAKAPVTLRSLDGNWYVDFMTERIKTFQAKFPHITVKTEQYAFNDLIKKQSAVVAAGTMGDVTCTFNSNGSFFFFAETKVLRAVDDLIASEKFDLTGYYPLIVDHIKHKGKIYGLPFKGHPGASQLYYNRTMLEKEGVEIPTDNWTWDKLTDAAAKLTKTVGAERQWGLIWPTNAIYWRAIYQAIGGGDVWSEDGTKAQLSSPEVKKALEWMHDVATARNIAINPTNISGNEADMFVAGKVGMWYALPGSKMSIGARIKDKFKWMVCLAPKGFNGNIGAMGFTDTYAVTTSSKIADEAWEWVKFLCDKQSGILLGLIGTSGGRPDVYESPELMKNEWYPPEAQQAAVKAMSMIKYHRHSHNFRDPELTTIMQNRLDAIWTGKEKPTQPYLDQVNGELQAVLNRPSPTEL
jgi:multiple sugar transport system substrate-binding protein